MNKSFIAYLSNKLKTGNLKTIHLNALPGRYATRLDLTKLDILSKKSNQPSKAKDYPISLDFLFNNLLTRDEFQFKISFENASLTEIEESERKKYDLLAKRLDALYNQDEDNFLEHGLRTFSFGFPLLIKRSKKDANKIIKAPVFLWSLTISRSNAYKNHWTIVKTKESPIYLNEVLISYINSDENVTLDNIPDEFLNDNVLNEQEINEVLNLILKKFNSEPVELKVRLEECPDVKDIERISPNKPWIIWAGIFGLFKTQKQSIINDSDKLLEEFEDFDFEDFVSEPFRTSLNTSVLTDPSQEEILSSLEQKEYKIIQGPPGTGKSQSLTAIITNALENGGKILVVCEKKTALDVIYQNLKQIGLEKLVALVDDVISDRKRIIDTVRQIIEEVKYVYRGFHEEDYDSKLEAYKNLIGKANGKHHNLLRKTFKGYNLQNLISECLKYKKKIKSNERLLDGVGFLYTDAEFDLYVNTIKDASEIYEDIPGNAFVYDNFAKEYFLEPYSQKIEIRLFNLIDDTLSAINSIEFDKIVLVTSYKLTGLITKLKARSFDKVAFKQGLDDVDLNISRWNELIANLNKILSFARSENLLICNKQLADEMPAITTLVTSLEQNVNKSILIRGYLANNLESFRDISQNSDVFNYNSLCHIWKLFSKKQRDISRFWKTIDSNRKSINNIFQSFEILSADEFLFGFLENSKYRKLLNDQKEIINDSRKAKMYFREYYLWRHLFETESEVVKQCLNRLSQNIEPKYWSNGFKLSYLNLVIEKVENELGEFHTNNKLIDSISTLQDEIRKLQRHKILKYWEDKQFHLINDFNRKSNIKWLFNYQKNSRYSKRNSLRNIIHDEFDLFTTIFPVVLVNPVVSSSILPLKQNIFDVVIFDEASQLRLEDTYPALIRGKLKIISGDKHQMPPSNYFASDISLDIIEDDEFEAEQHESHFEKHNPLYLAGSESLLEFGNNLNPQITNTSYLDFHYRSRHPFLIDFSNAAFYGSRLVPMPAAEAYTPIRFFEVNGLYESNHTNPSEAKRIVEFLKQEYPVLNNGRYPSLGIATFNLQQRNLIKDLINEESIKNSSFREKLQLIGEKEDWFVKNLENIQGDERDIIIISTTFGRNAAGKFEQYLGPINTYKGYKLLNVIITRAKKQVIVFTSIPEETYKSSYENEIATNGNKGKALLYCYLDYCKAVSNEDEQRRKNILELLKKGSNDQQQVPINSLIESPFEQEVYEYLLDYIDHEKIVPQYPLGGFKIDFVLLDKYQNPSIAIECDGAAYHSSEQAYCYDIHRQRILENQGLNFIRIWSKSWWPDPNKEIYKILKLIEEYDATILKKAV